MIEPVRQQSDEWRELRRNTCNASEAAAVMNCGKFFPRNQDELLRLKHGEEVYETSPMKHGKQFESEARAWCEEQLDVILSPASFTREVEGLPFQASLDGISLDGGVVVEIKCPLKGMESKLWKETQKNQHPPIYYMWQMVHQAIVVPNARYYFCVYDVRGKGLLLDMTHTVITDPFCRDQLMDLWKLFWKRWQSGEVPEPEFIPREDEDWRLAAVQWQTAKSRLDAVQKEEREARERLIALARDKNSEGHGVRLTRYHQKGRVDYSKIPLDVDLEQYRSEGEWRWRIK